MRKAMHTPWSDTADLLSFDPTQDAEGYRADADAKSRTVICTWEDGVSQNEFYLSDKTGLKASASVELWTADYQGEEYVGFDGRFFRVLRAFVSGFDYTTLILSEVVR